MNPTEQTRFQPLYQQMQQVLTLQDKRPKTIDAIHEPFARWRIMLTAVQTT